MQKHFGKLRSAAFAFAIALAPAVASATTTVAGVSSAVTVIITIIQVILAFIAACLFGAAGWEYIKHKHVIQALMEIGGGIVLLLVAFGGPALATSFGLNAALLH